MDKNTLRVLREYLRNCAPRSISLTRKEKSESSHKMVQAPSKKKDSRSEDS